MKPNLQLADDDFTLFGLLQRQRQDTAAIDACRRELQARVHPDRFAHEGAAAQRLAMQWATRVNGAWQRLKDPLARAAYLCELRGVPVDAERNTSMAAAFLGQQMQWREALDEAAGAAEVQALDDTVAAEERRQHAELEHALDVAGDTAAAAALVRALMFTSRFRADLARRLDSLEA